MQASIVSAVIKQLNEVSRETQVIIEPSNRMIRYETRIQLILNQLIGFVSVDLLFILQRYTKEYHSC